MIDMAAYMREYRARGRDITRRPPTRARQRIDHVKKPRRVPAGPQHVPGHHASTGETIIRDETIRHELRDGSGLMWPERAIGDPKAMAAEVTAALRRAK